MNSVRTAKPLDIVGIRTLETAAFGAGEEFSLIQLRQLIDLGGELCVVAEEGQEISGYLLAARSYSPEKIWVLSIAVHPKFHRSGIAQQLVSEFLDRVRRIGGKEVWSTVEPENAASLGLLQLFGCKETTREPNYFGPGTERLVMKLALN